MASLKDPGAILFVSCYELGHQPLAVASPAAVLRRAGYRPAALDLARQRLDPDVARRARLIAIAVPMLTALRLGVSAGARLRALNPGAHLAFYGLYATLNAEALFEAGAGSVIGGEYEEPLLRLAATRVKIGNKKAALKALEDAVKRGVKNPDTLTQDPDLQALASEPEFQKLVEELRARK